MDRYNLEDAEDLRQALQAFRERYNEAWNLRRYGDASPVTVRRRCANTEARSAP